MTENNSNGTDYKAVPMKDMKDDPEKDVKQVEDDGNVELKPKMTLLN